MAARDWAGPRREPSWTFAASGTVPAELERIVAIHDGNGGIQLLELGYELVGFLTRGGEFGLEGPQGPFDLGGAEPWARYTNRTWRRSRRSSRT